MIRNDRADVLVQEMHDLGARFNVSDDVRWTWQPHPEVMRNAIRQFWQSVEDRPAGAEMVRAIRKLQGDAP